MTRDEIAVVLDRHEKVGLSFSGGKDSTACVFLLREFLHRVTVYHVDGGDLLPETQETVARVKALCPDFVTIRSDVDEWITRNGLPSDLIAYTSHPIGRIIGQSVQPISARYDCCFANIMRPLAERIKADGCTLLIRGTKSSDMPALPVASGTSLEFIELLYPLQDWSDDEVLAYLRSVGAPISRVYETGMSSLDCARCSAWWSEGRGVYLKANHPGLYEDYRGRLSNVLSSVQRALGELRTEWMATMEEPSNGKL